MERSTPRHLRTTAAIVGGSLIGWLIGQLTGFDPTIASVFTTAGSIVVLYFIFSAVTNRRGLQGAGTALAFIALVLLTAVTVFLLTILP